MQCQITVLNTCKRLMGRKYEVGIHSETGYIGVELDRFNCTMICEVTCPALKKCTSDSV